MEKFMYFYSGLNRPAGEISPEYVQLWMSYFAQLGSALLDHGAPFLPESRARGTVGTLHVTGYSII